MQKELELLIVKWNEDLAKRLDIVISNQNKDLTKRVDILEQEIKELRKEICR